MLKKAYLEITNVCNLSCSFCHGTKRKKQFITKENFVIAAQKLRPHTGFLYFHLMGEPLLHPDLADLFDIAARLGFKVIITTNGTLLSEKKSILLNADCLYKVSISVHAFEANGADFPWEEYLEKCLCFAGELSDKGKICVIRLWNLKNNAASEYFNRKVLGKITEKFSAPWKETYSGYKLCDKIFIEWGDRFEWPDMEAEYVGEHHSCYGLRDQIGVLCDGSVVPCCLDAEGQITLGNIFEDDLGDIFSSYRAVALKKSFECKNVTEELCQKCGFAARFR